MPQAVPIGPDAMAPRRTRLWFALAAILCVCLVAAAWLVFRHRATVTARPRIRSIAVLPLRNLSGDPAQEYLADGITEAVIGRLCEHPRPARDLSHLGDALQESTALRTGDRQNPRRGCCRRRSVIKEGDRIRVTAQLIRGATDTHFWSETYDREMRDALTLESELAQSIAEKVEVTVTGEEHQRLAAARPVAPEVYESYLKGRFALRAGKQSRD